MLMSSGNALLRTKCNVKAGLDIQVNLQWHTRLDRMEEILAPVNIWQASE